MHTAACSLFRLRAFAAWFSLPSLCSNWKSNSATNSCQCACFEDNLSWSKKWHMELLFVLTTNLAPRRYCLQDRKQWTTASIYFSDVAYLLSASFSFWLSYAMGCSSCTWTPPRAKSEASVSTLKGFFTSAIPKAGPSIMAFLRLSKSSWHREVQFHLFPFFNSSVKGYARFENPSTNHQ